MENIAIENNLAETAFTVKEADGYHLRWFTPGGEIDLCGHATLAAAYLLFRFYEPEACRIMFQTKSGPLEVVKTQEFLEMDFPAYSLTQTEVTQEIQEALGLCPVEVWKGRDLVCVLEDEEQVHALRPVLAHHKVHSRLVVHPSRITQPQLRTLRRLHQEILRRFLIIQHT